MRTHYHPRWNKDEKKEKTWLQKARDPDNVKAFFCEGWGFGFVVIALLAAFVGFISLCMKYKILGQSATAVAAIGTVVYLGIRYPKFGIAAVVAGVVGGVVYYFFW